MILYRARTIASRPRRSTAYEGNGPEVRVRGRWFTSCLAAAIAHRRDLPGDTEIVMLEMDAGIAESFRVATNPVTECRIEARRWSDSPSTDYVLPMFRVMQAEPIAIAGTDRIRDYIDINARHAAKPVLVVHPPEEMRLAA